MHSGQCLSIPRIQLPRSFGTRIAFTDNSHISRLKIKCDRQIPCSSCVRRGCGQLCPNDHFSTGDGTRFASAAEEILRRRIRRMLARVRALEDALHNEQALVSDQPHPLLAQGDFAPARAAHEDPQTAEEQADALNLDAVTEALGTLSIARDGSSRFFGRSAGPTILLVSAHNFRFKTSPDF
jgi:hypothetical protein